jgi:ABC-type polysaccharide/polyol phosphate export permease
MHLRSGWLFLQFTSREVSNRFAGSLLGGLWAFVHPLALLLVYGLVFSAVFSVRLPAAAGSSYLVFVAVALWPWLAFQEAVLRGTAAVTANAALVKKVPFSHALLVYSAVSASFAIHLFGYLIVLAVLALRGDTLYWQALPVVALCLLILYVLATGLALLLSAVHVFVRDVEQGLAHFMALLFYLTPVLFGGAMVPEWLRSFMSVNPLAHVFESLRSALLTGNLYVGGYVLLAAVFAVAVFLLGRSVFSRASPRFEEAL